MTKNCERVLAELKKGPLAVGISSYNLQFYGGGVFSGPVNTITDHAVLLVGYNPEYGFRIKNVWGRTWGLLGYGWVDRTDNAGICSRPIKV